MSVVAVHERQAIQLLLVRALEEHQPAAFSQEAVSGAAIAAIDADSDQALLERRAAYLCDHLPAALKAVERVAFLPEDWLGLVLLVMFLLGTASNYLDPSGNIHVLYNPISLLVVWNVGVYVVLVWRWARGRRRSAVVPGRSAALGGGLLRFALPTIWVRWSTWRARSRGTRAGVVLTARSLAAFFGAYADTARSVLQARAKSVLHLAAIGLVGGAIVGSYVRGLFVEYDAVWRSTFVHDPGLIGWLLNLLVGPAVLVLDGRLLGAADVEPLLGRVGTSAAPWIHRLALTAALLVVLPRAFLVGLSARRARRAATRIAIDLSLPYFSETIHIVRTGHVHRVRDEIATLVRVEVAKLAEATAAFVRETFFDRIVVPSLITFRTAGGRVVDLEAEIAEHRMRFEARLAAQLEAGRTMFERALESGVRTIVRGQLAAIPRSASLRLGTPPRDLGQGLAGAPAADLSDLIGVTVTAAVATAVGTISGGVGKTLGVAILSTLLGTSGPIGLLLGALGAVVLGGGAYLLGRRRLTEALKARTIPAALARVALRDSRIERARGEVYARVKAEIEAELDRHVPAINRDIVSGLSAAFTRAPDEGR